MRVETGLIVVGSADDYLRMRKSKKRSEGITQSIVDRCILDEIGEFVGSILSSPYAGTSRQVTAYGTPGSYPPEHLNKRGKMERIRNNSNGSSIESEPPSPQPKITRPGNNRKSKRSQSSMNYHGLNRYKKFESLIQLIIFYSGQATRFRKKEESFLSIPRYGSCL